MFDILSIIASIATPIIGVIGTYFLKSTIDLKNAKKEDKEINDEVTRYFQIIDEDEKDVLSLMIKNVAELREYYVINKQQARNSFSAALFISLLGFVLFSSGIVISYMIKEHNIIQYSTIGGAIVEVIAGLFFWLYSKAITQINLFHTSLLKTERFLTAIQLVEKITVENRDETYSFIISKIINEESFNEINQDKGPNKIVLRRKKQTVKVEDK